MLEKADTLDGRPTDKLSAKTVSTCSSSARRRMGLCRTGRGKVAAHPSYVKDLGDGERQRVSRHNPQSDFNREPAVELASRLRLGTVFPFLPRFFASG